MPSFSFNLGGGGSRSRAQSHARPRRNDRSSDFDDFDDLTDRFDRMDAHFDKMWDDMDAGFSRSGSGRDGLRSGFRHVAGMMGRGRDMESDFDSGFPGMPGRGRSGRSGSMFDSEAFSSSLDSDFPGMPGMPSRGRHERFMTEEQRPEGHSTSDDSRPFRMWEDHSGSSSRRHRSPSPIYFEDPRGFSNDGRQPRGWAPSSFDSRGYDTGDFDTTSTARPFRRSSPSPPPRRRRSPSPPPRRRRSPSPPPRRRRSPSPPRRPRHTPDTGRSRHRSPSPVSRGGSRREAPESRKNAAFNEYGRPRAQSTSHNQYRGEGPKPRPRRAPSPPRRAPSPPRRARSPPRRAPSPPRRSGFSRSQSHARSGTSSGSSRSGGAPSRSRSEPKKLFDTYNAKWEKLSRTDKNYPIPASSRELSKIDFLGGSSANFGNWSSEEIFVANVQVIFLAGFGISSTVSKRGDHLGLEISKRDATADAKQALAKWLGRKEQPRWHPDRMNLRTGREGKLDDSISKKKDVVAMRSAAQELLGIIG